MIKLANWIARQFGYRIVMAKIKKAKPTQSNAIEEKPSMSLVEKLKSKNKTLSLVEKLSGKKKTVPEPTNEPPAMTLRDKLKECGKL